MTCMGCPVGLLFILTMLHTLATSICHGNVTNDQSDSSWCSPDQAAALLQLKQSFFFDNSTTTLPSWQAGTDCCLWEGIGCDGTTGHVTVLDLRGRGFYSYSLDTALFNLTSLRYLDLSMNDFGGSRIPALGFERLSMLTHLNLSYSGFYGQIPKVISKLTSLVSLDLSAFHFTFSKEMLDYNVIDSYNYLVLQEPSFETLVAKFKNLKELYLDGVDISSSGEEWSNCLATSVPHLQVLSMGSCKLSGPIHSSVSSLRSLTVINLELNPRISGVFPEFFADFLNLSVLQLVNNDFSGWFPQRIFHLNNLEVLDLSGNDQLSGNLPEFPNGSPLKILNLQGTNFSSARLSSFSSLKSLRVLAVDGGSISVEPPYLFVNKLKSLRELQLSLTGFSGELESSFSWIRDLKNLKSLIVSDCNACKAMPSWIGNLTNLRSLEISDCGFSGPIPPSIGNLRNLTALKITDCAFSGIIPSSLGNLKKLRSLEISLTGLSGQISPGIGDLNKLMVLVLWGCGFSGRIPSTIGNLTRLIHLDLSANDLSGEIPTSIFTLPELQELDLSSNHLSGPLQEFDTTNSRFLVISLGGNQISGHIPESLFQLTSLVILDLPSNNFTGLVELTSFHRLRKLHVLNLSNNKLFIMDGKGGNSTFPLLPKLLILGLASCSMTTIPSFLMKADYIGELDLSCNQIHGTIPKWMWEKWDHSLTYLNLSHNIFTDMQLSSYVLPNSRLGSLDLSFNRLQGQIPMPNPLTTVSIFDQVLDYSNNRFSSVMSNFTSYLSQTAYLKMSKNNITGHIPQSICNSSNLEVLDLSYNNFSGLIPSCLIENSRLGILNLRENNFEGGLPSNVNDQCNLQTIDLHGNKIQGQLPMSLSNCTDLEILDIGNNQMVDTFPSWLGRLSNLRVLVLRSNQFYGSVANPLREVKFGEYFSKLQIIDIASNNFSGNLNPRWFERLTSMMAKFNDTGKIIGHQNLSNIFYYQDTVAITYKGFYVTFGKVLTTLTAIDFSNNALDSGIPESVGKLVSLHVLNMSHNAFTGNIPTQLGEVSQLESLDLSCNQLSGDIPQELTDLTFLATLNLSKNDLEGRIPQSRQFATFENNSYEGNERLCGPPLSKQCGNSSKPNKAEANMSRDHIDVILFLFVGLGFGVGFAAVILTKWGRIGKWPQIVSISRW